MPKTRPELAHFPQHALFAYEWILEFANVDLPETGRWRHLAFGSLRGRADILKRDFRLAGQIGFSNPHIGELQERVRANLQAFLKGDPHSLCPDTFKVGDRLPHRDDRARWNSHQLKSDWQDQTDLQDLYYNGLRSLVDRLVEARPLRLGRSKLPFRPLMRCSICRRFLFRHDRRQQTCALRRCTERHSREKRAARRLVTVHKVPPAPRKPRPSRPRN